MILVRNQRILHYCIFGAAKKIYMAKITAAITAVGGYVPEDKLTNADLEKMVDTNDEWIRQEQGLKNVAF